MSQIDQATIDHIAQLETDNDHLRAENEDLALSLAVALKQLQELRVDRRFEVA